jgi:hypothetical protein
MCVAIPKNAGVNPLVSVTVNGAEVMVAWGANLGGAIRASGEPQPEQLLFKLAVYRAYNGRRAAVEFDPNDPAVLGLILLGGEAISWK